MMVRDGRQTSVLVHFLPHRVLQEARALASSFQREDLVRRYALKHIWLIVPLGLLCVLASMACAIGAMLFFATLFERPIGGWRFASLVVASVVAFATALVVQLYALLSCVSKRALKKSTVQ
jgi:hypothetical protein